MNSLEKILTIECSLLAIGIIVVSVLIVYNVRKRNSARRNNGGKEHLEKKCVILPPTRTPLVELERPVEQISAYNLENNGAVDDCTIIDETSNVTEVGRLYFSLTYEPNGSALTVKLIRGENLPSISQDMGKAYVNVQIICHKPEDESSTTVEGSKIYQRAYTFCVNPSDFLSHMILFEVSRFDRFSRKYDVAHVVVALSELQAELVDLSREKFFAKDVICNWNVSRKRRHSSDVDRIALRPGISLIQRNVKVRHGKPKMLWSKPSHAVRSRFFEELRLNPNESLQWDPFLIVQRCELPESDMSRETNGQNTSSTGATDVHSHRNGDEQEKLREEIPRWLSDVFHSSNESRSNSPEIDHKAVYSPPQQRTLTTNQEFYRLVHSPSLARKDPVIPVTSWSIPETFRLPPKPARVQTHTVLFQRASTIHQRHDRLHKLTSLSANYRERILRKSRRRSTTHRSRLTRHVSLHESLYLGKYSGSERTHKRQRKTTI